MPKDRITLLACTNATGTDRVNLLTIGKAANPRCFSRINRQALGCVYMHSKKAWMTSNLFRDWFYKHFVPHVTSYLRKGVCLQRQFFWWTMLPSMIRYSRVISE